MNYGVSTFLLALLLITPKGRSCTVVTVLRAFWKIFSWKAAVDRLSAGEPQWKGVLHCTDRLGAGREGHLERIRIHWQVKFQLGISKA